MTATRYSMRLIKSSFEGAAADRPYSCEVFAVVTLEPLYVTDFYATPREAQRDANGWCERNLGLEQ